MDRSAKTVEGAFPLTPLQEGMLYHALRDPASALYHGQSVVVLEGPLAEPLFRRAWELAAEHHEAFRTFFTWERRERPLQVVLRDAPLGIRFLDWRELESARQRERWTALLERDRLKPFDLGQAPLMRLVVARVAAERHELLWSCHHAILDGWSAHSVLNDVLDDYEALRAGRVPHRAPPPSFGRFVGWLAERDRDEAEVYWRRTLSGFTRSTPLPGVDDGPPSGDRSIVEVQLSAEETAACRAAAARLRVTMNTLSVAAWALLLGRHTGADDVAFGITLTERPPEIPGVEGAAGLYLSTIPTRVRLPGPAKAGAWIKQLQDELSAGRAHGTWGLSAIRRWSEVEGDRLFESLVAFESFPEVVTRAREGRSLRATSFVAVAPSDLPLSLIIYPNRRLTLQIVHDPSRVSTRRANKLLQQFGALLMDIVTDADRCLDEYTLQGASNVVTTMAEEGLPPTAAPTPEMALGSDRDVVALFEERAREQPEAVALWSDSGAVSYGALEVAANRMANRILERGARPGALVGVLGDRSPEVIAAILGVLKAGCAYLPLDPELPPTRLRGMATPADLVLAQEKHARLMSPSSGAPILLAGVFDQMEADGVRDTAVSSPAAAVGPDAPAYVVYTSGSTGVPKGVVVERGQLAWSTAARFAYYRDRPACFLLLSSLSVDSSVAGLYWTLCGGGTLVVPRPRAEQDLDALAQLIEDAGVTHTLLLPSLYRAVLENVTAERLVSVRCVVVAGEACSPEVVRLHVERMPGAALYNEYGPSETTVWATVDELTADDQEGSVPIGRPVPSARIYVLDEELRHVPGGEGGEIFIGGPGVARGYLGRSDLTAERFLLDPYHQGGRMYRTGDRGRWRGDGRLEFLGRLDDQIKVRGFRVESAEVEAVLEAHPAVAEAMVGLSLPIDVASLTGALLGRSDAEIEDLLGIAEGGR